MQLDEAVKQTLNRSASQRVMGSVNRHGGVGVGGDRGTPVEEGVDGAGASSRVESRGDAGPLLAFFLCAEFAICRTLRAHCLVRLKEEEEEG